jgi:cyclin-dependent kinase-like
MWALGCMIGELVDGQPMLAGDDEVDQIYLINKLVGNLTYAQQDYFSRNPKFENIQLPEIVREETVDLKYLGKI